MHYDLSVVIPAYNEAERLGPGLRRAVDYLKRRGLSYEVLVVDDGSRDATVQVAEGFAGEGVRVLRHERNRGKGGAVQTGLLASLGERVLLSDADFSTPIEELEKLEPRLRDAALVVGSRALASSDIRQHQPRHRELMGKTFNLIIRALGVRGLRDTQCGFKLVRGDVGRALGAELTVEGFAYDVELVWLARRHGHHVVEVGVVWSDSPDSRVDPLRSSLAMLRDVVRIRLRHRNLERSRGRR
ncbi:MAG TPA: dolichyl-phosphate beta-glucosyltransferase [Thermoanaerobaculia bacterium]|nr:dolichyl-phosphate beta-glucosyltransferase [Thermoanaerobaculia bacterium]